MKSTCIIPRLGSLSYYIGLFIVCFASLVSSCDNCNRPLDDTIVAPLPAPDNTPAALSLQFKKALYDRDNKRLVVIIANTGQEADKDLSLCCTNISKDLENHKNVLLDNQQLKTNIAIATLAASSSTSEIYIPVNLQTATKALVQIDIVHERQVITTTSISINASLISLIPIGSTILLSAKKQQVDFKCKLETYGKVDFSKVSLEINKIKETAIEVSVGGNNILDASTDARTISGAELQKLAQREEILVRIANSMLTDEPVKITYTLYVNKKAIDNLETLLIQDTRNVCLLDAIKHGDPEIVQKAIEDGADVNQKKAGITMMAYAVHYGHPKIVELLTNKRADVNALSKNAGDEFTALVLAVEESRHDIVEFLLNNEAHVNDVATIKRPEGSTAWEKAIKRGDQALVEILIKHGFKVNTHNEDGNTGLHIAVMETQPAVIEVLMKNGADINLQNGNMLTPWELAVMGGNKKAFEALIKAGMDVDTKNEEGSTSLHIAASFGGHKLEILKLLLQHGANKNIKNKEGETAIDLAPSEYIRQLINNWVS